MAKRKVEATDGSLYPTLYPCILPCTLGSRRPMAAIHPSGIGSSMDR